MTKCLVLQTALVTTLLFISACSSIIEFKPMHRDAGTEVEGPVCGNGIREGAEECDDGRNGDPNDGCTDECAYSCRDDPDCSDGHECTSDVCDTVTTHTCRNEIISAVLCRSSAGECDAEEYCDGVNIDCPVDSYLPATAVCRPAAGDCDLAECCTGSSAGCPADVFQPEGTPCNDGNELTENDQCDGSGSCTGTPAGPPGPVWVSIPAGSFEMGCSPGDTECDSDEEPRHTVNVSGFEMTETEITQAQYEWVTGSNPSQFYGCAECPVENVTWHEAKAFCEAIGGRLPSEAEWEYAARAGTTTRYYCGDDAACLDSIAWYGTNSSNETHPVAEKTANAFGLYDMFGNVWEQVEDCWHEDYTGAPSMGEVWSGGDCGYRVLRGGSWYAHTGALRVSYRNGCGPDFRNRDLGFRCVQ